MAHVTIPLHVGGSAPVYLYRYDIRLLLSRPDDPSPALAVPFAVDTSADYSSVSQALLTRAGLSLDRVQPPPVRPNGLGNDYFVEFAFQFPPNAWTPRTGERLAFVCAECRVTTMPLQRGHLALRDILPSFEPSITLRKLILTLVPGHHGIRVP